MNTNNPDFASWNQGNLVNFALEAYLKLQRQDEEIQQLRIDLKDAINAYRQLVKQNA